jgi:hypothetical protein
MQDVLLELQPKLAKFQRELTHVFDALMLETEAEQGFLAFENLNRSLGIVANKGEYWHLSRDQGATGRVVTTGHPSITDSKSIGFQKTERDPYSELIYPVRYSDEVVGAILLDNFRAVKFEERRHYPILIKYCEKINEILLDRDPWTFRKWWQEQQSSKRGDLFDSAQRVVQEALNEANRVAPSSELEGRVESITHQGTLALVGAVMGRSRSSQSDDRETINAALRTGRKSEREPPVSRYEYQVPFPFRGPVVGIATLVAEKQENLPSAAINTLEKGLQRLEYRLYAPAVPRSGPQGAGHYFRLVLLALTSPTSPVIAHEILEAIAEQAERLCDAKLEIHYVPEDSTITYSSHGVKVTSLDDIQSRFIEAQKIERPYCMLDQGWLVCPILVRGEVRGLVQVESDVDGIGDIYNAELVVVVALLVTEMLERISPRQTRGSEA